MADTRHYLTLQPMPLINDHVGLKITARSSQPNYTCEYPQRKQVAKENFSRRKYQVNQCGYQSSNCKPYNELGHVVLDSKKLILNTLGQQELKNEPEKTSSDSDSDDDLNEQQKDKDDKDDHAISENEIKKFKTIEKQLDKSLKVMRKVQLGRSLFDLIDKEKQQTEKHLFREKRKEQKKQRSRMSNFKNGDRSDDSETDQDEDITQYIIPSPGPSSAYDKRFLFINENISSQKKESCCVSLSPSTLQSPLLRRNESSLSIRSNISVNPYNNKRAKKKDLPRPYSPVYTNLNFYRATNSDALFRQLCVVNWILEAMSQDNIPPIMSSVSTCWNLKDLKDDPKLIQRRIEREKVADPIWQSFLANPTKFQSKSHRRHRCPSIKTVPAVSSRSSSQGYNNKQDQQSGDASQTKTSESKSVTQHIEEKQNKVTKVKNWQRIRASYNFEPALSSIVFKKVNEQNSNRIKQSNELMQVPMKMKEDFSGVKHEQAIILHDNLEAKEKTRWKDYEKKYMSLSVMRNLYETLDTIRQQEETIEQEDEEGNVQATWYVELIEGLPSPMRQEKSIGLILKKLQKFCDLEGRKISSSHFLRALSILRPFELCYPHISAAIEFIRDKIVMLDKKELEIWCKKHTKRMQRSRSAPPTI